MMDISNRGILIVTLAAFCSMVAMRVCDPLLPTISEEFQIPTGSASAVIGVFSIAYGLSQFLFGPLADRFGSLYVIGWALLLSVLANLGVALSENLDAIIFWRGVSGATTAGVVPLSMAWIGESVSYETRQATLARFLFGVLGGTIAGQILGGICADSSNWRIGFYLIATLYLGCLIFLWVSGLAQRVKRQSTTVGLRQSHHHFINVLSKRWSQFILIIVGIEGIFLYGAMVFVPAYLHLDRGISLTAAGLMMSGIGLGGLLYASTARRLLTRLREQGLVLAGGVLLACAFLLLLAPGPWPVAAAAIFAMGLGLYMLHNTLQTHATQMTPQSRSTAVSLFACALFFGQSLGISGAGWVVDHFGFTPLFWISGLALPLLALWFAAALKSHPLNQH